MTITSSDAPARRSRRSSSQRVRGRVPRKRAAISIAASASGAGRLSAASWRRRRPAIDARLTGLLGFRDPLDANLDRGDLAADLGVDLVGQLGVILQEVTGVLTALPQAGLAVVEPGPGLGQDPRCDPDVQQPALDADPLVVHDVELGEPE